MPGPARAARLSPWGRLVALCAVVVLGAAATLLAWSLATTQERRVGYTVRGSLTGLALDLGSADVLVEGGGRRTTVAVEHVDHFGFGHDAVVRRSIDGGVFSVRSRCPATIMHRCRVRYRLVVPDNLPLTVQTGSGSVQLSGYRGQARVTTGRGDIDIAGFCGFSLQARAEDGGDVTAGTACPPPQLSLRTTTGAVHAFVPGGRYRIDASTSAGRARVRGVASDPGAPFAIQALSGSGSVVVERAP